MNDFFHEIPDDMQEVFHNHLEIKNKWEKLTKLAQNEWICWVITPKKQETREKHLHRLQSDLLSGKKRPCCWPGCPHRNPKTQKYFQ